MSEYNAKNYTEQGGDVTHIGGKLIKTRIYERLQLPENVYFFERI